MLPTELPGVLILESEAYTDDRGYFMELWRRDRLSAAGVPADFVQDNVSLSHTGVLRGLHFQHPDGQAKLVSVLQGEIFDVAVDVRRGSPTFRRWVGVVLSGENHRRLYIPRGFAHGFLVTRGDALVTYKATAYHSAAGDMAIAWDDPEIAIRWGSRTPVMSARDRTAPRLRALPPERLPRFDASPADLRVDRVG
jgi:dTDP-4-dehydrorhamnose 3,5-epimerase